MAKHAIEAGDKSLISGMKGLTKVYKCEEAECSKVFHYKEGLDGHMIVDHGREDLKWNCKLCAASYIHKRHHDRHMREKHLMDKHGNKIVKMNDQGEPISTPETAPKATPKSISKSKTTPKRAPKSTEKSTEKQSERTRCKICSAKFETSLDLDSHLITEHQHEGKWTCKECQSKFILRRHLFDHMMKIHQMDKDGTRVNAENGLIKCSVCSDEFPTKSKLDSHLVQDHGHERSHQCDLCGVKEIIFNIKYFFVLLFSTRKCGIYVNGTCPYSTRYL